ncbi:MAG: tyrosine-type recombinase/integrase [Dehalococcoidia bacterium]|jgi:site-specific recombinase XerC
MSISMLAGKLGNQRNRRLKWCLQGNPNPCNTINLLNKLPTSTIAELSNCSKAYISQVRNGKRPESELLNIKLADIRWESRTIRVLGKGNKEGYAPFGLIAEQYLKFWLTEYNPQPNQHIWDIGFWGIKAMLEQLGVETDLTCNPHTFRRTFACLLRKAGIDTMTIKELGRWESLEMVQRYTRSFSFQDSMKFYKSPLS